ncbi:phage tail protein [Aquabacterium sp.]|uniref:phage tail protein n=1 Tax=Aquabacterium sp. TaxID=1872578 RepID=UPI0025BAB183|nr:phage tail protein [Aquabacterium sp.]
MIDISVHADQLDQIVLDLAASEDQVEKALRSTISKMANWLRARTVRGLSDELKMQQRIIRRRLKAFKFKQTARGGMATVWYGLNPVGMIYLGAKQDKSPGGGVTVKQGAVRNVPGAFIATMRNGHEGVFKRRDKKRLRIDEQETPIQGPANQYLAQAAVLSAEFTAQFFKTFEHELQWRTR